MVSPALARRAWRDVEPLHTMIYFVPEAPAAYAEIGVTDTAMGYFGSRAAPMGRASAEVVHATFFNFSPALVHYAVPAVWDVAAPEALVAARLKAADQALRRGLGEAVDTPDLAEAAELTRRAALAATERPEGRPLFAAHAALPWPDAPHLVLWHAQTLLREFRGDGHIAALVLAGVTGLEANLLHAASGEISPRFLTSTRAWSAEQWSEGAERLRSAGLLTADAELKLSEDGARLRQEIEDRTDEASVPAYAALGEEGCERLRELARPLRRAAVDAGLLGRAGK
ncbi:SCO6745 family protein [Actinomadura hibisca]